MTRPVLLLAFLAGACGRAPALPFYRDANLTPEWLSSRAAESPALHHVAAFRALDQHGQPVSEQALVGRVTVAHFFFTRCRDVCPLTTSHLGRLLAELPADQRLQVLSYSVAPGGDSVQQLADFAREHQLTDPRWHLLTGDASELTRLARESYFVRLGADTTYGVASIAHTETLVLVDGRGRLRGLYAGTLPLELQRLREDIATLLREQAG